MLHVHVNVIIWDVQKGNTVLMPVKIKVKVQVDEGIVKPVKTYHWHTSTSVDILHIPSFSLSLSLSSSLSLFLPLPLFPFLPILFDDVILLGIESVFPRVSEYFSLPDEC